MATQSLKDKIAAAKKNFKKAKEIASQGGLGNANVEDGRYHAQILSAKGPVQGQNSGRLQAVLAFEIQEGEFKGQKLTSFPNLENEIGLGILIRELNNLGYEIEDFEQIEATLAEVNKDKPQVRISVKTKGEYQNISIDKLMDAEASEDLSEAAPEDAAPEEAAPEEGEIAEGDTITFTLKGEETQAEVTEVVDENSLKIKTADGKLYKIAKDKCTKVVPEEPAEDAAPEEVEDLSAEAAPEEVTLEVGSAVTFTLKGKEVEGEITEVVDEETVKVKYDGKVYKLGTDKIQPAEKAPKAKVTRKIPGKKK